MYLAFPFSPYPHILTIYVYSSDIDSHVLHRPYTNHLYIYIHIILWKRTWPSPARCLSHTYIICIIYIWCIGAMGGGERDLSKAHVFLSYSKFKKKKTKISKFIGEYVVNVYTRNFVFKIYPWSQSQFLPSKLAKMLCTSRLLFPYILSLSVTALRV